MRFQDPGQTAWALLVLAAIALYLFRPRARTVAVSTLLFFQSLAQEHRESAWLRRLKRLLSFLLAAGVILASAGALGRPLAAPPEEGVRAVVLLLDRSASMAVADVRGRSRLAEARDRLRVRLSALPAGTGVLLLAYDRRPEILASRTFDRREIARALDSVAVRPLEGDGEAALRLAVRLAVLETPAVVWHASDESAAAGAPELPAGVRVEPIDVAVAGPVNAGLTAFDVRRLPLDPRWLEAFVEVQGVGPAPLEAELAVLLDGRPAGLRRFTLASGTRERLLLPLEAGDGSVLTLRVSVPGDRLPLDDSLTARVPEARTLRVLWVSEDPAPFTRFALAALAQSGDLRVFEGGPADWPPREPVDVAVLERWLPGPGDWPDELPVIAIDPPGASGPVQASPVRGDLLPVDAVRTAEERHPVLFGVAAARVALAQTAALPADGPLQPLWVGPAGPLLLAGEVRGRRAVVMGFDPARSERLALLPSFPLLLGNAIYWATDPGRDPRGPAHRPTGSLVAVRGTSVEWRADDDRAAETGPIRGGCLDLDRIGRWRTEEGEEGSASLLSARETRLPAGAADPAGEAEANAGAAGAFGGELAGLLVAAVLACLMIESWLFHRHGVY